MTWFWLSFADGELPEGHQFLGAVVIGPVASAFEAMALSHFLGINPGGEVLCHPIAADVEQRIPDHFRKRLLDRDECAAFEAALGPAN